MDVCFQSLPLILVHHILEFSNVMYYSVQQKRYIHKRKPTEEQKKMFQSIPRIHPGAFCEAHNSAFRFSGKSILFSQIVKIGDEVSPLYSVWDARKPFSLDRCLQKKTYVSFSMYMDYKMTNLVFIKIGQNHAIVYECYYRINRDGVFLLEKRVY